MRLFISLVCLLFANSVVAQSKDNKSKQSKVSYSTSIDFDSTMIDGKMKAPSGFFLQGRNKQSLQSMVGLRSNFREELNRSQYSVRALIK